MSTVKQTMPDNPTISGANYAATHKASVVSLLGREAPRVSSRGSAFFNADRWTVRIFTLAMCRWAKANADCIPTRKEITDWVREANQHAAPRREIVIAATPAKLSLRVALALTGGAYHEAAHTLYSCRRTLDVDEMATMVIPRWALVPDWSRYYKLLQSTSNIAEDIRIERLVRAEYPGTDQKMHELQDFILHQEAKGLENAGRAHGGKAERGALGIILGVFRDVGLGYNTALQREALEGYKAEDAKAVDFVLAGPATDLLRATIVQRADEDIACLQVALDLIGLLYQHSNLQDPANDKDDEDNQPGEAHVPACPDCGAKGSKLVVRPKSDGCGGKVPNKGILTCSVCGFQQEVDLDDAKDAPPGKPGKPEDTPRFEGFDDEDDDQQGGAGADGDESDDGDDGDDASDGSGSDAGDEDEDGDTDGDGSAKGDSDGDEDGDTGKGGAAGDDSDDSGDEDGTGASGSDDGDEDADGDDSGTDGDDGTDGEDADGDSDGDKGDDGEDGGDQGDLGTDEDGEAGDGDNPNGPHGAGGHNYDPDPDWSGLADDALDGADEDSGLLDNNTALQQTVDEDAKREEQREGGVKAGEQAWRPYDPTLDEVVTPAMAPDDQAKAERLFATVRSEASFLRARFRNLMRAMEMQGVSHGWRKGRRLSERFLTDTRITLMAGRIPKRAYKQVDEAQDSSMAAFVSVDESSSITRAQLKLFSQCMMAIVEPLDALGCPTMVAGWRDGQRGHGRKYNPDATVAAEDRDGFHRYNGIVHDVFKAWHEPFRAVKGRFVHTLSTGGTPMSDGIQFGLQALSYRDEAHRVMFVITDGCPNGDHIAVMERQLRLAKETGIHVIGVGIGSGARYVENTFPDHVYSDTMAEMPALLIGKLNELIDVRATGRGKRLPTAVGA